METSKEKQEIKKESYNGQDDQFQSGSFSKTPEEELKEEETEKDTIENPGDAFTRHQTKDGLYDNNQDPVKEN